MAQSVAESGGICGCGISGSSSRLCCRGTPRRRFSRLPGEVTCPDVAVVSRSSLGSRWLGSHFSATSTEGHQSGLALLASPPEAPAVGSLRSASTEGDRRRLAPSASPPEKPTGNGLCAASLKEAQRGLGRCGCSAAMIRPSERARKHIFSAPLHRVRQLAATPAASSAAATWRCCCRGTGPFPRRRHREGREAVAAPPSGGKGAAPSMAPRPLMTSRLRTP
mmetsp:Transcript_88846/g.275099  ORF Transcript_88846/g.275099 Transcript_88846/m.275099 type:complete len:222 (-) Transcript_88846:6-671(-)